MCIQQALDVNTVQFTISLEYLNAGAAFMLDKIGEGLV